MSTRERIQRYFEFRKLMEPDLLASVAFLQTEVGELIDALIRRGDYGSGWVRNNPDKQYSVEDEMADVYMMLWRAAMAEDIDLDQALINKMARKGFSEEEA